MAGRRRERDARPSPRRVRLPRRSPRAPAPERRGRARAPRGRERGAVVFTLLAWHALGKARSGALVAAGELARPAPWPTWRPSPGLLDEAALVLAAAMVGLLLARSLSGALARAPPRALAAGGLALVLAAVLAFHGATGLAVLAASALVGAIPIRLGVRRSHLMGAILVPATMRIWGWI